MAASEHSTSAATSISQLYRSLLVLNSSGQSQTLNTRVKVGIAEFAYPRRHARIVVNFARKRRRVHSTANPAFRSPSNRFGIGGLVGRSPRMRIGARIRIGELHVAQK